MIMEGRFLAELDGKTIRDQDRRYLYALAQQMSKKRLNRSASLQSTEKKRQNSLKGYSSTNQGSQFGYKNSVRESDFNFGTGAEKKKLAPGNSSQQNQNPFGTTDRGFQGKTVKTAG